MFPRRRSARLMNIKAKEDTPKKQNKEQAEIIDLSNNLDDQNTQSKSWECTPSARKHLTPDVKISPRCSSLRSTKKLIESGKTVTLACPRPQKSREHSSASNAFQQLDHPPTVAPEMLEIPIDVLEIPTDAPENLTLNVPEMEQVPEVEIPVAPENLTAIVLEMEQVPEVEMSTSNPSNQIEVQNTFEAVCIPPENEFLSKDIQASNNFEGIAKKYHHSKSISVGPSPSFTFNTTEMVNMLDDEDDDEDEVSCVEQSETLGGYQVKQESKPILRKILNRYGDIAKDCVAVSMKHRSILLEMICDIISKLQEKNLGKIRVDELEIMIDHVNDLKNAKVDIEWLRRRLVEILDARRTVDESRTLREKKEVNAKFIEIAESKLRECEAEKKEVVANLQALLDKETLASEELARAELESTRIMERLQDAKFKVKRFVRYSMADGLI